MTVIRVTKTAMLIFFASLHAPALLGGVVIFYVVKNIEIYYFQVVTHGISDGRSFFLRTLHSKALFVVIEVAYFKHVMWLRRLGSYWTWPDVSLHQNILARIIFFFVQTNPALIQPTCSYQADA